jgi:hypothetical protein
MGCVIVATDCLGLKQDHTLLETLFKESKYLLKLGFIEYLVVFNPRSRNNPAHVLTNLGAREIYGDHAVWLTDLLINVSRATVTKS